MPTIDSAEKRMRQNEKKRKRNKTRKARIRTLARRFEDAIEEGNLEEARNLIGETESAWDRAASKGVIPKSRASRKIGRLKKMLSKLENEQ
ncbi:MAG: 30S ribosomal protein S20 [Bradymonadaceae bacterium]